MGVFGIELFFNLLLIKIKKKIIILFSDNIFKI